MNVFNILRYPIDKRFTLEDLSRLPDVILHDWWYADLRGASYPTPDFVNRVMQSYRRTNKDLLVDMYLEKLKDRIKNYDNLPRD